MIEDADAHRENFRTVGRVLAVSAAIVAAAGIAASARIWPVSAAVNQAAAVVCTITAVIEVVMAVFFLFRYR
ncbi:MAG TPA: hypothetical protein VFX12_04160 [Vicinamibacterales bacterium]|nr:hypothetical protein [Vicinamibacterales bacterium]